MKTVSERIRNASLLFALLMMFSPLSGTSLVSAQGTSLPPAQSGTTTEQSRADETRTVVIAPSSEPLPNGAVPAQSNPSLAPHPSMKENQDGELKAGEYEVISMNGSITRALCPYTCEMRGLPKQACKSWKSAQEPEKCYLQDTRLPSNAVPVSSGKTK